MKRTVVLSLLISAASTGLLGAQSSLQASGRAATAICSSNQCRLTDTATVTVLIEYGQPHARGRTIFGGLVPLDTIWRLGANTSTHLVTRVPLNIGGSAIPAGTYTLWLRPTRDAAQLVVSNATGVWGTAYAGAAQDRARIVMRSRNLQDTVESFRISLVPATTPANSGVLTIAWGRREFSVDWNIPGQAH